MKKDKCRLLLVVSEDWYFLSHRLPLALAVKKMGMEVYVACRVGEHGDVIRSHGLQLIPIHMNRSGLHPLKELATLWELFQIYRKIRPDIIHHVALKPSLYGSMVARGLRFPNVVNALAGLGHVFMASDLKHRMIRSILGPLLRWAFKCPTTRMVFQNPDDRDVFVSNGFIKLDQTRLIKGSGVDTDIFSPKPSKRIFPPMVVLVGRMLWTKGVGEFVEAAKILKKERQLDLVLVGDPDPLNPASIPMVDIETWEREKRISYWGRREDIPDILNMATISVLPSYREGLPKSLIESAACGLPLVAFDRPGSREIVAHGKNGVLVPFGNIEELASAIAYLLDNPSTAEKMGRVGRARVMTEFSQKNIVNQTLRVYGEFFKTDPKSSELRSLNVSKN